MKILSIIIASISIGWSAPLLANGDYKNICEKARYKAQEKCFKSIDKKDNRSDFHRCIDPFWDICKPKVKYRQVAEGEKDGSLYTINH